MATVASIVVNLTATTHKFDKSFKGASRTLRDFVYHTRTLSRGLNDIASYGKKAAVALTAMGASTIGLTKAAANHEESILRVKALTRSTVTEFNLLKNAALDTSTKTVHSLKAIDEAMDYLAMAGYKAQPILDILPAISRMSVVGKMALTDTAGLMVGTMAGYQMGVEELGRISDVMAASITGANINLYELGETMKYIGPVASSVGMEFEEAAAITAILGQANIKGSMAGTALRTALTRLIKPAGEAKKVLERLKVETQDSGGELRNLSDIIADLVESGATAADLVTIFNVRSFTAMSRLVSLGAEPIRKFVNMLHESQGLAAKIEDEQLQSFNAQLSITKNKMHALAVEIGDTFLPYAKTLNYGVGLLIDRFKGLTQEQKNNIAKWIAIGATALSLITVLGVVAMGLNVFVRGFVMMGTVLQILLSPFLWKMALLAVIVSVIKTAWDKDWKGIRTIVTGTVNFIIGQWDRLTDWWASSKLKEALIKYWEDLQGIWKEEGSFWDKLVMSLDLTKRLVLDQIEVEVLKMVILGIGALTLGPALLKTIGGMLVKALHVALAGGLAIGKVVVASLLLTLAAGAIGWIFGDTEGRDGFLAAVQESIDAMLGGGAKEIAIGGLNILADTFDFGSDGLKEVSKRLDAITASILAWQPSSDFKLMDWLMQDIDDPLAIAIVGLLESAWGFIKQAVATIFDFGGLLGSLIFQGFTVAFQLLFDEVLPALVDALATLLIDALTGAFKLLVDKAIPGFLKPLIKPGLDHQREVEAKTLAPFMEKYGVDYTPLPEYEDYIAGFGDGLLRVAESVNKLADTVGTPADPKVAEDMARATESLEKLLGLSSPDPFILPDKETWKSIADNLLKFVQTAGELMLKMPFLGPKAGFASGGYTGNSPVDEIVGVVHGQEMVIPAKAVNKGLPGILKYLGVPGFKEGTGGGLSIIDRGLDSAKTLINNMKGMFEGLGKDILAGLTKLFGILISAIETLAKTIIGEEKWEELKDKFQEFKLGIQDIYDGLKDVLNVGEDLPEPKKEISDLQKLMEHAVSSFSNTLLKQLPIVQNAISAFQQTFTNTQNVSMGVIDAFLSIASSSEPFGEALRVLAVPINIVANVLGALLVPVLKALFPIIIAFGMVLVGAATMIGLVWNAILDLISLLPFVNLKHFKINIEELTEAQNKLRELTWESAAGMEELNKQISEALYNIPRGLKIVANRLSAIGYGKHPGDINLPPIDTRPELPKPGPWDPGLPNPQPPDQTKSGSSSDENVKVEVILNGDVYGVEDLDRRIQTAVVKAKDRLSLVWRGVR